MYSPPEHDVYHAKSPPQAAKRRTYLETVFSAISTESFTREIGQTADPDFAGDV